MLFKSHSKDATTIPKKIKETVHQTFDVNFKVRLAIGTYYV